jgi:hypothetical protein
MRRTPAGEERVSRRGAEVAEGEGSRPRGERSRGVIVHRAAGFPVFLATPEPIENVCAKPRPVAGRLFARRENSCWLLIGNVGGALRRADLCMGGIGAAERASHIAETGSCVTRQVSV